MSGIILSNSELEEEVRKCNVKIVRVDSNYIHYPIDEEQIYPMGIGLTLSNEIKYFKEYENEYFSVIWMTVLLFGVIILNKMGGITFTFFMFIYIPFIGYKWIISDKTIVLDDDDEEYTDYVKYKKFGEDEKILIRKNETIIGILQEHIDLPKNMYGIISSNMRYIGMGISVSMEFVSPNVRVRPEIEIKNISRHDMYLKPNMKLCYLNIVKLR